MSEKYYTLGTHTTEQWTELHAELIADGNTYESVPAREVTVEDDKLHSPTRGSYLLTLEEATALRGDGRVKFINESPEKYPEIYMPPEDEFHCATDNTLTDRWADPYNNYQMWTDGSSSVQSNFTNAEPSLNRTTALYRMQTKQNPWKTSATVENVAINAKVQQVGAGENVDIICADNASWIGHTEFINSGVVNAVNPSDYEGGNVLPGNGICDCLDLVLDAPYYIDPDWFNETPTTFTRGLYATPIQTSNYTVYSGQDRDGANGGGPDYPITIYVGDTLRLTNTSPEGAHPLYIKTAQTTGTGDQAPNTTGQGAINGQTVTFSPTEAGTYYYQCSSHGPMGGTITVEQGDKIEKRWDGTIVPKETNARQWWQSPSFRSGEFSAFGNIPVSSSYTRNASNGSNTSYPTSGTHGTQCASLIFGRTHGWAYNANKWILNLYGTGNPGSMEIGFDLQKVFHQYKPVNTTYGTKDPTMSSNSWGYRSSTKGGSHYHWRTDSAVAYSGTSNEPGFISWLGATGDGGRWKSEMYDNSMTAAGDELTQAGVIMICAAGNSNQPQYNPDHPNYDNRISNNDTNTFYQDTFDEFGFNVTGSTNRRGFPQHIGKTESQTLQGNTTVKFPAINIGALDDDMTGSYTQDRKVNYSDMGNAIDLYAPADGTLAATEGTYGVDVFRTDDSYSGLTAISRCRDTRFSGTSAACPVACGFLALVMQYNRGWTYDDLRNWIQNNLEEQPTADMYEGVEVTSPTASWSNDYNALQGSPRRILYQATIPVSTAYPSGGGGAAAAPTVGLSGPIVLSGISIIRT
jgi:plastocyanin